MCETKSFCIIDRKNEVMCHRDNYSKGSNNSRILLMNTTVFDIYYWVGSGIKGACDRLEILSFGPYSDGSEFKYLKYHRISYNGG